jgi:hypothetical protein
MRCSRWKASNSKKALRNPPGGTVSSTRCGKSRSFARPRLSRLRRLIWSNPAPTLASPPYITPLTKEAGWWRDTGLPSCHLGSAPTRSAAVDAQHKRHGELVTGLDRELTGRTTVLAPTTRVCRSLVREPDAGDPPVRFDEVILLNPAKRTASAAVRPPQLAASSFLALSRSFACCCA